MSSSVNLEDFRIPLEELKRATNIFHSSRIKRYNKYESHELEIVSRLHNKHIIPFIGYCDEDENYIYTAYQYFNHKSLDDYLQTDVSSRWSERLKFCIIVAKVLNYLHSGVGELGRVIHGDVKRENILCGLDDNCLNTQIVEPIIKVIGFKHSKLVPLHQHHSCPEELFKKSHTDPIYKETNLLNAESDIYSFGVLMFEVLHGTGSQSDDKDRDKNRRQLMNLVRRCYDEGPYKLVDPNLEGKFGRRSLKIFTTLAYKCISFDIKERPKMDEIIKTIEKALDVRKNGSVFRNLLPTIRKFEIPTEEIEKALGYKFYDQEGHSIVTRRGKLVDRCNDREVFFKQFNEWYHVSMPTRIRNELFLISSFHHENITPFIGCHHYGYSVTIASEYALNGSLYSKLEENSYLTWAERLKICLGAARGLKCFHASFGEHKVIHGDFKSKSILLYDNLESKICGFGKSFLVPRSYPDTNVYKEAQGSKYYMDPIYRESCIPRVESNVYSFGVVLFEVLTGVLACNHPVEDERISMC